jgi:hypothetical protein
MSSIIRSVSLDEQTSVIAKSVPNFSRFVRECLLRYHAVEHQADCPVERINGEGKGLVYGLCTPSSGRICLKHWPQGMPPMDDWRKFRDMNECDPKSLYRIFPEAKLSSLDLLPHGSKSERIQAWIQHRAEVTNPAKINFNGMVVEGNAKYRKKEEKAAKRRFLDFLRRKKR